MGRECGMIIGEEKCIEGFGRENLKKNVLGDVDLGGNILLKLIWKDMYKWRYLCIQELIF